MKVSCIIMPFDSAEYLIRCVNSLYRQLGEDYEVTLAENVLDEKSLEFLKEKPQTAEEKLFEAASLLSDDCECVQLLDVNTVISPIMAKTILECEHGDLIVPAAAIKEGSEFIVDAPDAAAVEKNYDKYAPQRFCFGRELFKRFIEEIVENEGAFSLFLLSVFAGKRVINFIDDVCMYADGFAPDIVSDEDIDTVKSHCEIAFELLPNIAGVEARIEIIGKFTKKFSGFLADENVEIRRNAFCALQDICENIQDNFLFRKYFEGEIGFNANDFLMLDFEEYEAYKMNVRGAENTAAPIDIAVQNKLLKDMKDAVEKTNKELSELKKISAKPMIKPSVQGAGMGDPANDVPRMYREGRLGLKTMWRSFCGWLKYKFSGKK